MFKGKITIGFNGDAPMVEERIRRAIIPPTNGQEIQLEGEYLFKYRVQSTARGGARWETGEALPAEKYHLYASPGPYNRVFYGRIINPIIDWLTHDCEDALYPGIVQHYKPGYNIFTKLIALWGEFKPLKLREVIVGECNQQWGKQGHLEVFYGYNLKSSMYLDHRDEYDTEIEFLKRCKKDFLNHYVLGGEILFRWREDEHMYGLLYQEKNGWIVSRDHLWEPISVSLGFYVLKHLIPQLAD